MRIIISLFIVIILLSFTSRKKQFVPPGTVKYNDTLFVDETEISNFSWQEYEIWIKEKYGKNSPEHLAVLPDTLIWKGKGYDNEPYVKYYYRHSAYRDYPVVGISYEQAIAYCKWRTDMVKMFMAKKGKYGPVDFEYRLPSKKEWETLSYNGRGQINNNGFNEKGMRTLNCVWEPDTIAQKKMENETQAFEVTAPVYSYWKNFYGLYNMMGNVAEMVLEKGICKGGSWRHEIEQCRAGNDIAYDKPKAWLGFRCVCVVKKSPLGK